MADYIDRQAVNDALDKMCDIVCQYSKRQRYAMCGACPLGSAYDVIENVPPADVQPVRHGKWIKAQRKGIISYADGFAECNKCHEVSWLGWNDKYCRNCGADMRGDNDV